MDLLVESKIWALGLNRKQSRAINSHMNYHVPGVMPDLIEGEAASLSALHRQLPVLYNIASLCPFVSIAYEISKR